MARTLKKGVLKRVFMGATALTSSMAISVQEIAADDISSEYAVIYATYLERSYAALADYIFNSNSSATDWAPSDIPPESTGWRDKWSEAGLRARYCDDTLLVYFEPAELKGVGDKQQRIRVARSTNIGPSSNGSKLPPLGWLDNGVVTDAVVDDVVLPDCIILPPV